MKSGNFFAQASNSAYDIWFRYSDIIYKHCLAKCRDEDAARDFYQEIFLKFHRNAQKVAEHPTPYYWFLSVIDNQFKNQWRKRKRRLEIVEKDTHSWYRDLPVDFFENPEETIAFISCSSLEKMILDFLQAGFCICEIGSILGLSSSAIHRRLIKIRDREQEQQASLKKEQIF